MGDGLHGLDLRAGVLEGQLPADDVQDLLRGVQHDLGHQHVLQGGTGHLVVDGIILFREKNVIPSQHWKLLIRILRTPLHTLVRIHCYKLQTYFYLTRSRILKL